jgi:hypothetical protein
MKPKPVKKSLENYQLAFPKMSNALFNLKIHLNLKLSIENLKNSISCHSVYPSARCTLQII